MLPNLTRNNSPNKGRPVAVRPDGTTPVLQLTPTPPVAGPIHAFSLLVRALHERDQAAADEARRELRRRGYNVVPIGTPKKGGRACLR